MKPVEFPAFRGKSIDENDWRGLTVKRSTYTNVVSNVTGLYPATVDDIYRPGTVAQLQWMLRQSDKPVSVGGGRYSMGGQIGHEGSLHIDMRGINRVLDIDTHNKTVRVEGGATWRDVQLEIDRFDLSISIMQTYANFSVGGSLSVNCHGRYVGLGPVILSVLAIKILTHDGTLLEASPDHHADIFFGAIGGYGALGIIVEAVLSLADNVRIERIEKKMALQDYPAFFRREIREDKAAIFHNADIIPPGFRKARSVTWVVSGSPVNTTPKTDRKVYFLEKYMLWVITETRSGHFRREYIYEPLMYLRKKVTMRNEEANYDVAELEPVSREQQTYVLQEYFVPVASLLEFAGKMQVILSRYAVKVVNVSIRHSHPDPGSCLAWATEEVFALVLYYKQGVAAADCERVAVWTRELIDAAIACGGRYYLPYQPHATVEQFHAAYPHATRLFELKQQIDPNYRFRHCLWEQYYRRSEDAELIAGASGSASEFRQVYALPRSRDDFYRFLQNIYHLYPEHQFHQLIIDACTQHETDQAIYEHVAANIPAIKPFLSELTYALPALAFQKKEMGAQTAAILGDQRGFNGYLEIGSTGRYVKVLKRALGLRGPVYLTNDVAPDNSPPDIMERGKLGQAGTFFSMDDYAPIPARVIADQSLDLVTCYIGLHHCPADKLSDYIASIARVLRPGGKFVLRDHHADTPSRVVFCSLVHAVFNAGLGVDWAENQRELRLFNGIEHWVRAVTAHGFKESGERILQDYDPSLNTLVCFVRE